MYDAPWASKLFKNSPIIGKFLLASSALNISVIAIGTEAKLKNSKLVTKRFPKKMKINLNLSLLDSRTFIFLT